MTSVIYAILRAYNLEEVRIDGGSSRVRLGKGRSATNHPKNAKKVNALPTDRPTNIVEYIQLKKHQSLHGHWTVSLCIYVERVAWVA